MKAVEGGQTTYWVYSALTGTPLYHEDVAAGEITQYVSGGGTSVRVVNGTVEFTHLDAQGSPIAATDGSGSVLPYPGLLR